MKMKAEIGVMNLQAREHHRLLANHQKLADRHGTDCPSEPSEGSDPAVTLF